MGVNYKYDYDLLGITTDLQGGVSNLFAAINIGNPDSRLNETEEYRFTAVTAPKRDWTFRGIFQYNYFRPLGRFHFAWLPKTDVPASLTETYTNTLATFEARYAYKEVMVARGNERVRLVRSRIPVLTLQYSRGLKGVLGGQFEYDRVSLNAGHHFTMGVLGNSDYSITVGKIFGTLPYPLLDIPRGNQAPLYSDFNFSLMNLYEFCSDEFVQALYVQHFEGLFFNRIPLLKKLKWRNFAVVKAAHGHLSQNNKVHMPAIDKKGRPVSPVYEFDNRPYVEGGAGIENIFHVFSLSYIHRFSYLEHKDIRKWGINLGLKITF